MNSEMSQQFVAEIKNLFVEYKTYAGMYKVLNGVNLVVRAGEKIAIVGETGCCLLYTSRCV